MEQIEGDAALIAMISELFFEQHFNDIDVRSSSGCKRPACMGLACFIRATPSADVECAHPLQRLSPGVIQTPVGSTPQRPSPRWLDLSSNGAARTI